MPALLSFRHAFVIIQKGYIKWSSPTHRARYPGLHATHTNAAVVYGCAMFSVFAHFDCFWVIEQTYIHTMDYNYTLKGEARGAHRCAGVALCPSAGSR